MPAVRNPDWNAALHTQPPPRREPVGSGQDDDANESHDHRATASRIRLLPKGRKFGADRFIGTPDAVIKIMLEAALRMVPVVRPPAAASDQMIPPATALSARIVTTTRPKPWR